MITFLNVPQLARASKVIKKFASFIGPGLMVSVAYMDPGNYATGVTAGASNRYALLFVVLASSIMAIFLQSLCIKLGSVTGHDLARCSREHFPKWLNITLWILAECAIIATDVAEVIGLAVALNILLKVPLPAGVAISIADVIFVLMAYRAEKASARFVRYFELAVGILVLAVLICFAIQIAKLNVSRSEVRQILRGFAPSKEMIEGQGVSIAASIIGATVMIHLLFLGSGIVQPRLREYDVINGHINLSEKNEEEFFYREYKPSYKSVVYSLKYSIAELTLSLATFAVFVNLAILVVAGHTLYGTPQAIDADLYTIHNLLLTTLAPTVGTIFMLALLLSGLSAGIVCTIAGQIVSEGHINWSLKPWVRRLVTRGISIVPCFAISVAIGRSGLGTALNVSQLVISLLLPFLTAPLIYFTSKKSIMCMTLETPVKGAKHEDGRWVIYMANSWVTTIIAIMVWLLISVINVYAIYDVAKNGVAG